MNKAPKTPEISKLPYYTYASIERKIKEKELGDAARTAYMARIAKKERNSDIRVAVLSIVAVAVVLAVVYIFGSDAAANAVAGGVLQCL